MDLSKRYAACLLAGLIAVCLLFAALAEEAPDKPALPEQLSEADILGAWQLYTLRMEGNALSPEAMGISMQIEFREDHTVQGTFAGMLGDSGQAVEPWELDVENALILTSGQPYLKVRVEDGTLFLLMDEEISGESGSEMVFVRAEAY